MMLAPHLVRISGRDSVRVRVSLALTRVNRVKGEAQRGNERARSPAPMCSMLAQHSSMRSCWKLNCTVSTCSGVGAGLKLGSGLELGSVHRVGRAGWPVQQLDP